MLALKSKIATLLIGLSLPTLSHLSATEADSPVDGSRASVFTKKSLEESVAKLDSLKKSADKEKKSGPKKFLAAELETKIIAEIQGRVIELIGKSAQLENTYFQTSLKNLRVEVKQHYLEGLKTYGQADRSEEENDQNFIRVWKNAINTVYLEEIPAKDNEQEKKRKTTILNILMRSTGTMQLDQKVQTLIENGADRNLHKEFFTSPRMNNQSEYPLRIALTEIEDQELRYRLLKVLLDDNIRYQYHSVLKDDLTEALEPAIVSLQTEGNARYVLNMLLDQSDFKTFNIVLGYVETHNIFVTEEFTDRSSQIENQIKCDVLENILRKMRDVRQRAFSTAKDGRRYDNIGEFYKSEIVEADMATSNDDNRFDETFRERLLNDFEPQFEAIAQQLNATRKNSEITGPEFKDLVIEWAKWAHFRNRVASHLNRFAMAATNKAEKSNVIKLIRYANTYKNGDVRSELDEVYMELYACGGRDIIFNKVNRMGWTPLMYAMFQKQSDGFQLLVHQVQPDITIADGVDNNILHLAFPLPEEFFKAESGEHNSNVLEYVGLDSSDKDMHKKTFDAIKAILTEKTIPIEQKVKALTHMSAGNYTPVSLAAALGFHDIYNYLVEFLKAAGAWNRDDHEHLADPIEKICNEGLRKFVEVNSEKLSAEELAVFARLIKESDEAMDQVKKLSERFHIYHQEDFSTRKILELVMKPAEELLNSFDTSKRNAKAPFEPALSAAIRAMLASTMVEKIETKTIWEDVPREVPDASYQPKKRGAWKSFKELFTGPKPPKAPRMKKIWERVPKTVTEKVVETSPLEGLRYASSIVKSSYLAEVVSLVVDKYLFYATGSRKISFDDAYRAITECETKNFFQKSFNETVEKRMQKIIREKLRQADRLKEEETTQRKNNRFDGLGKGQPKDTLQDFEGDKDVEDSDKDSDEDEVL